MSRYFKRVYFALSTPLKPNKTFIFTRITTDIASLVSPKALHHSHNVATQTFLSHSRYAPRTTSASNRRPQPCLAYPCYRYTNPQFHVRIETKIRKRERGVHKGAAPSQLPASRGLATWHSTPLKRPSFKESKRGLSRSFFYLFFFFTSVLCYKPLFIPRSGEEAGN